MILSQEFEVDTDLQSTWQMLEGDLQQFVPCFPGAYFIGQDGEDLKIGVKVKIGVISSDFRSTVRIVEMREADHTAVIKGSGEDARGNGKASATINAVLHELPADRTRVAVESDVSITGRIAQFGGPIIEDVAARLIGQFTKNLNKMLNENKAAAGGGSSAETADVTPAASASDAPASDAAPAGAAPASEASAKDAAEALDLGSVVGPVLAKYALRFVVVPVAFFAIGWFARGAF